METISITIILVNPVEQGVVINTGTVNLTPPLNAATSGTYFTYNMKL